MALPVREQLKYWGIATLAFIFLLWLLGDVILPFILGAAVAYILDPVADWLQRRGLPRIWATMVITIVALLIFVVLVLLVVPTLVNQATALAEAAPEIVQNLQAFLIERFPSYIDEDSILRRSLSDVGETVRARGGELVQGLLASVGSVVNALVLVVIVPVVTFYLLMDWDRIVARVDALLPRDHAPVIRRLAREIDDTLAGFIRGQGTVCIILGTYYAVALMAVGLPFGLVIGFIAGLLTFIPYVGALVGGVMSIGLALFQFWGDWIWIVAVWAIFQSGQFVEGNILTPKLVGDSVGLHPVWLIFALSAFGALFGFVGLLVAVPVAAIIGVLVRFGIERYRDSTLYTGIGDGGES
ncbi:AI-2E family transporter [Roseitranquillus sediminis]|uniref:AI-2E family transporter n=1 Tax=Roseitranquillus sediminis TaxID=2809051 RepID=UPI001D0CA7BF|nr:AI-2E family transporter [Roseitranquillus sediminis]MBM9595760.1 AI-2E family transporter [Roseitranquillus sediminis]